MNIDLASPNPSLESIFNDPSQLITLDANLLIPPDRSMFGVKRRRTGTPNGVISSKVWTSYTRANRSLDLASHLPDYALFPPRKSTHLYLHYFKHK